MAIENQEGVQAPAGEPVGNEAMDSMVNELVESLTPEGEEVPADDPAKKVDPVAPAAPAPAKTPEQLAADEAAKTAPKVEAPKTWKPEVRAHWDKIPPEAQAEILKREDDMYRGLEGYKQNAHIGKSVLDVMRPYLPALEEANINPLQQISGLMHAHYTLSTGTPEQKQQMFQQIAKEYGVYVAPSKAGDGSIDAYVDPQVDALQKKLTAVESKLTAREQSELRSEQARLTAEINAFASKPEHQYFDEVATDVAALLKANPNLTLKDAYEKAVWANPQTRAKEQARLQAETDKANKAEAARKAAEAKKATGANVTSKTRSASVTASTSTDMDDVLAETLASIQSRR